MKKQAKQLSSASFEAALSSWEQRVKEFIFQLCDGSIATLADTEWTVEKRRILVCEPDEHGKKKRAAFGPCFDLYTPLNRTAASAVWKKFKQFAKEQGLNQTERWRNNEKELGRYDFKAADRMTGDKLSCRIELPGEWNKAGIHVSIFVGSRYRNEDL